MNMENIKFESTESFAVLVNKAAETMQNNLDLEQVSIEGTDQVLVKSGTNTEQEFYKNPDLIINPQKIHGIDYIVVIPQN